MNLRRYLRNRAVGLARRAMAPVRSRRVDRAPTHLELSDVRRRLELLLGGMYGRPLRVGAQRPSSPGAAPPPFDVLLPEKLDARDGLDAAAARYRLLAIEQAERLERDSGGSLPTDRMERDLYLLAEGAAVDRAIARRAPGLGGAIASIHGRELAARPPVKRLRGAEREVELLARSLLHGDPSAEPAGGDSPSTPAASLAWARSEAARIRGEHRSATRYRGVRSVRSWRHGVADYVPNELAQMTGASLGDMRSSMMAAPSTRGAPSSSEGDGDEASADGAESATATSVQSSGGTAEERDGAGELAPAAESAGESRAGQPGISYPEWDDYAGRYKPDATTVHDEPADLGDERWALETLDAQAAIVRQVRARFSQLRAHRVRLRGQRSGDELDLDACVSALVDMRMNRVPTDRVYLLTRPARRTLAIVLLVDVSGSTRSRVSDDRTVLDVERMTVLLAGEALDALGDPYAVLAFSGAGAHDVRMRTVKRFTGDDRALVHGRIAGLTSMDYTRLGSALRHATAVLNAQPAERRLLLLLSDGKPNDLRGYQGVYAVEDSRQALAEARASGVHPFCLTVDREETEYLPHLFGVSGYRLMRAPEQLPGALLHVVEQLLPR